MKLKKKCNGSTNVPLVGIDEFGKVYEFNSTMEAERWLKKKGAQTNISACALAKTRARNDNLTWRAKHPYDKTFYYAKDVYDLYFEESTLEERARVLKIRKTLDGYDPVKCKETKVIYENVAEAHKKTGVQSSSICACLRGTRKTAGGYHWERVSTL